MFVLNNNILTEEYLNSIPLTIFDAPIENIENPQLATLGRVVHGIRSSKKLKALTEELRQINDKHLNSLFKRKHFPVVMWSGRFSKRCAAGLIEHSGLAVIDLDGIPPDQLKAIRMKLCTNEENLKYMLLLFTSPNGNGFKALYLVEDMFFNHVDLMEGLYKFLNAEVGIPMEYIDTSGKDVARACFLSYDPNIFLNPKIFTK